MLFLIAISLPLFFLSAYNSDQAFHFLKLFLRKIYFHRLLFFALKVSNLKFCLSLIVKYVLRSAVNCILLNRSIKKFLSKKAFFFTRKKHYNRLCTRAVHLYTSLFTTFELFLLTLYFLVQSTTARSEGQDFKYRILLLAYFSYHAEKTIILFLSVVAVLCFHGTRK